MIFFLTAISVSLDAYLAGLAIIEKSTKSMLKISLSVTVCTLIMCIFSLIFAHFLSKWGLFFKIAGSVIFLFLGVKNLLTFQKKTPTTRVDSSLISVAVAFDASVACLSILVSGWEVLWCALIMAIFHGMLVFLGMKTIKLMAFVKNLNVVSGIFLIMLAIIRLI